MEKNEIPQGFTLSLALMDALPVLFFGGSLGVCASMFDSTLFLIGAVLIFLAGAMKVGWKLVIALQKKNIWFLNRQMRYLMPAGFVLVLLSLFIDRKKISGAFFGALIHFPALLFFLIGVTGIACMVYFAGHNDQMDAKSNWKEQGTNAIAQFAFMIGLFLVRAAL